MSDIDIWGCLIISLQLSPIKTSKLTEIASWGFLILGAVGILVNIAKQLNSLWVSSRARRYKGRSKGAAVEGRYCLEIGAFEPLAG